MKKKYYIVPKLNRAVLLSAALMLSAAVVRIIYYTGVHAGRGEFWWQAVLPVIACILYAATLVTDACDRPYRTAIPVVLGCIFFAVKAAAFSPGHRFFCWMLYLLTAGLYYATVRHGLNKWLLGGLLGCGLAYQAIAAIQQRFLEWYTPPREGWTPSWWHFLAELTVLMTMTALLLATVSLEKRERQGWTPVWGDRNDGRRLRTVDPVWRVSPYIMVTRNTSSNFLHDRMECTALDAYIHRKRREGLRGFGALHVVLAAYARCVAQYPGVNRFISGQRAYSRQEIEIAMNVKPEMTLESPDTVIKLYLKPTDTAEDVYRKLQEKVAAIKSAPTNKTNFDLLARALHVIPGPVLLLAMWLLRLLDYFGCLPRALTKLSPFHGSLYITSMASLGIPPIYHHLYDFGNVPVFVSLGKKYRVRELGKNGDMEVKRYIDYTFVTDERICDGFYFASVLRFFRGILQEPECLDTPAAVVVQDIR